MWTLLQGDYRQLVHEQDQYQYSELRLVVLDIRSTYVRTFTKGGGGWGRGIRHAGILALSVSSIIIGVSLLYQTRGYLEMPFRTFHGVAHLFVGNDSIYT